MESKVDQEEFPRLTLKCKCGNEFIANVMRLRDEEQVCCQVCGEKFKTETGERLAKALEELYKVKYQLEREDYPFHFSFVYKSSFKQPPMPFPFDKE